MCANANSRIKSNFRLHKLAREASIFEPLGRFWMVSVKYPSYLSEQLVESAPYLKDAGFRETATLLLAAAAEIDMLRERIAALERPPIRAHDRLRALQARH